MPATISPAGQAILDDLPGYFATDPHAVAIVDALGRELARLQAAAQAFARASVPSGATDATGLLAVWEATMDLPVRPDGVSEAERLSKVLAHFRKRRAAKGTDWVALLTQAIGSQNWTHFESSPYAVTILLPQQQASYTAAQILALAKKITPANLQINVQYDQGFLVGYSPIGQRQI